MTRLRPNILINDAFGSAGALTAYHRGGKCFLRKRSTCSFPGTGGQMEAMAVHIRALKAWRAVPHEEQLRWEPYAKVVEPHRPPFDHKARISGNNLFISAYHGCLPRYNWPHRGEDLVQGLCGIFWRKVPRTMPQ